MALAKGWQKTWTVATFEFLTAVRRPGYLITTFGMPLFMAAYGGIVAIPAYFASRAVREPSVFGVVDPGSILQIEQGHTSRRSRDARRGAAGARSERAAAAQPAAAFMDSSFVFRPFPSEADARAALAARTIKGYFVLPPDYLTKGVVDVYTQDTTSLSGSEARDAFAALFAERLLSGKARRR